LGYNAALYYTTHAQAKRRNDYARWAMTFSDMDSLDASRRTGLPFCPAPGG
jgi:hypothetical protein